jgi:hypothetical protein
MTENPSPDGLLAEARRSAQLILERYGIVMPPLDPSAVPEDVRPLLPHAEILGIGDDGARGEIFEEVSADYLALVRRVIRNSNAFKQWYLAAEETPKRHSPEVAAIGWMLRGLDINANRI